MRNQALATLHRHYPTTGFASQGFHGRSSQSQDSLAVWIEHKAHWIVPVLNDVRIRRFDALSGGGIRIVPESLRLIAPVADIPRDAIVFYGPDDLFRRQTVVARALKLFDDAGCEGIAARHRHALTQHHGRVRVQRMVKTAQETFGFLPPSG